MKTSLALNLQGSVCLCFPSAEIKGVCHHTWQKEYIYLASLNRYERSWSRRVEAAGHIVSAIKEQRETDAAAQLIFSPFSFSQGPHSSGFAFLRFSGNALTGTPHSGSHS